MRGTTKEDGKVEVGLVTDGREEFQRRDPKSSGSEPLGKSLGGESGRERGALVPRNTGENERKPQNHDCPHCKYSTPHLGALKNHVNAVHLGEKPHQCPHCDHRTAVSSNLQKHVSAVHQGRRPHPCPHCDYRAKRSSHLRIHVSAMHSKERSHQCPQCDYRTAYSSHLRKHVSSVHLGQRPHRCPQCDYRAARSTDLKRHVSRIHGPPRNPKRMEEEETPLRARREKDESPTATKLFIFSSMGVFLYTIPFMAAAGFV